MVSTVVTSLIINRVQLMTTLGNKKLENLTLAILLKVCVEYVNHKKTIKLENFEGELFCTSLSVLIWDA